MMQETGYVDFAARARRVQRWRATAAVTRSEGRPLVVVAAGTGLAAAAAVHGGADLLAVYSSSYFRVAGLGSLAAMMPYANANTIVSQLAGPVVAAACDVPVIAGICATDPTASLGAIVDQACSAGFAGVQNFPTVSLIEGSLRRDLEAAALGFDRELELIAEARRRGLLACAFVANEIEARKMALAGAEVVTVHVGVTRADGGPDDAELAIERIERCAVAIQSIRDDVIITCHGGPFADHADLEALFERLPALDGYVAASMVEREPPARAVEQAVIALKAMPIGSRQMVFGCRRLESAAARFAAPASPPAIELTADNLADYLRERGVLAAGEVTVRELGGGVSNVLLRYEAEGRCGVVKQSRQRIRVQAEWLCDIRRVLNERDAIALMRDVLPSGSVPSLQFSDDANYVFAMECAPEGARLWKRDLMDGVVDLRVARRCGELLGRLHTMTWGDDDLRRRFANESLLDELRLDPWYRHTALQHPDCAASITYAAERMRTVTDVLVHGDFAPKNMLVSDADVLLLDWEIVHFGNPGYDVAQLVCHLLLKAHRPRVDGAQYVAAVRTFWDAYRQSLTGSQAAYVESEATLQLGCLLLARLDGKSPVEYLDDADARQRVRTLARWVLRTRPVQLENVLQKIAGTQPVRDWGE